MRVCVPADSPGGPGVPVATSFQDSDLFDLYDVAPDGDFELLVQIRNCAGTCKDNVETVVRRGVEAVIVNKIPSSSLNRLTRCGVRVYRALEGPSRSSLIAMSRGGLPPLAGIKS